MNYGYDMNLNYDNIHLESCTPGTRQYKMVCTGTSQYVPYSIQGRTRNLKMVHISTYQHHLESVEVGYSDIFLEYSIYLTTGSICLEYSDIYLEYVNPFPIPGICLEYA